MALNASSDTLIRTVHEIRLLLYIQTRLRSITNAACVSESYRKIKSAKPMSSSKRMHIFNR